MRREAYEKLVEWQSAVSRKPLLVQGARQVGKTFLIKEFGKREFESCIYLNFEEDPGLGRLFDGSLAPRKIIEMISAYLGTPVKPGESLLVFDEIQACPKAITSLKYLCEEAPEYHVIGAGSLLGVAVGTQLSFPVGKVSFMNLYPMSFMEFADALGEGRVCELVRGNATLDALAEPIHDKLINILRQYVFVGGMPEAVQSYVSTRDVGAVRTIQQNILRSFERDFSKYSTATQAVRVAEVWKSLPAQLARENKKFKYSEARPGGRASQFESAVQWLRSAGLVYVSSGVTSARLPLAGYRDAERFKLYLFDTGLLGAMAGVASRAMVDGDRLFSEYNGALTENLVASALAPASDGELYYWTSEGVAEVDFLLTSGNQVFPLEVKSGMHRGIKSLRTYASAYHPPRIFRTSPRNYHVDGDFANLPLYASGLMPRIVAEAHGR